MTSTIRRAIQTLLLLAAMLVSACHPTPRLDASTPDKLQSSLEAMVAAAPKNQRAAADEAVKRFKAAYPQGNAKGEHLPDVTVVAGMNLSQFLHFSDAFLSPADTTGPKPYSLQDVPYLRDEYRRSIESAKKILENAQEKAHASQLFTHDQFEIGQVQVLRPWDSADAAHDAIEFDIPFVNNTGLDVFYPTFQVTFFDPDTQYQIGVQNLQWRERYPVLSFTPTTLRYFCCGSGDGTHRNQNMRSFPANTIVRIELTGLQDSTGRSVLDENLFPEDSYTHLVHINACLLDLDAKGVRWTPTDASADCQELTSPTPPKEILLGDARRG